MPQRPTTVNRSFSPSVYLLTPNKTKINNNEIEGLRKSIYQFNRSHGGEIGVRRRVSSLKQLTNKKAQTIEVGKPQRVARGLMLSKARTWQNVYLSKHQGQLSKSVEKIDQSFHISQAIGGIKINDQKLDYSVIYGLGKLANKVKRKNVATRNSNCARPELDYPRSPEIEVFAIVDSDIVSIEPVLLEQGVNKKTESSVQKKDDQAQSKVESCSSTAKPASDSVIFLLMSCDDNLSKSVVFTFNRRAIKYLKCSHKHVLLLQRGPQSYPVKIPEEIIQSKDSLEIKAEDQKGYVNFLRQNYVVSRSQIGTKVVPINIQCIDKSVYGFISHNKHLYLLKGEVIQGEFHIILFYDASGSSANDSLQVSHLSVSLNKAHTKETLINLMERTSSQLFYHNHFKRQLEPIIYAHRVTTINPTDYVPHTHYLQLNTNRENYFRQHFQFDYGINFRKEGIIKAFVGQIAFQYRKGHLHISSSRLLMYSRIQTSFEREQLFMLQMPHITQLTVLHSTLMASFLKKQVQKTTRFVDTFYRVPFHTFLLETNLLVCVYKEAESMLVRFNNKINRRISTCQLALPKEKCEDLREQTVQTIRELEMIPQFVYSKWVHKSTSKKTKINYKTVRKLGKGFFALLIVYEMEEFSISQIRAYISKFSQTFVCYLEKKLEAYELQFYVEQFVTLLKGRFLGEQEPIIRKTQPMHSRKPKEVDQELFCSLNIQERIMKNSRLLKNRKNKLFMASKKNNLIQSYSEEYCWRYFTAPDRNYLVTLRSKPIKFYQLSQQILSLFQTVYLVLYRSSTIQNFEIRTTVGTMLQSAPMAHLTLQVSSTALIRRALLAVCDRIVELVCSSNHSISSLQRTLRAFTHCELSTAYKSNEPSYLVIDQNRVKRITLTWDECIEQEDFMSGTRRKVSVHSISMFGFVVPSLFNHKLALRMARKLRSTK